MNDQPIRFDRLLSVVRALEEAKEPEPGKPGFSMSMFVHGCGTPACALGHYAARRDLQSEFEIVGDQLMFKNGTHPLLDGSLHFGFDALDLDHMSELFSASGCGGAKTRHEAADYIRDFIRRHGGEA